MSGHLPTGDSLNLRDSQEALPVRGLLLFKSVFTSTIDLIFPCRCSSCGRVGWMWCDRCEHTLRTHPVEVQRSSMNHIQVIASGVHTGILQKAVHALKYDAVRSVSADLAQRLADTVNMAGLSFDVIVPVPLHEQRRRERTYNQAELIAQDLANVLNIPCEANVIQRTRFTRSQVGLNRHERHENVRDAFIVQGTALVGRSVLLVDDVYTTGATLHACASAILAAGAAEVHAVTVTSAHEGDHDNLTVLK